MAVVATNPLNAFRLTITVRSKSIDTSLDIVITDVKQLHFLAQLLNNEDFDIDFYDKIALLRLAQDDGLPESAKKLLKKFLRDIEELLK